MRSVSHTKVACVIKSNLSNSGSHKRLWIDYVLWLEMTGKVFLAELWDFVFFPYLYYISVNFVILIEFIENVQNYSKD